MSKYPIITILILLLSSYAWSADSTITDTTRIHDAYLKQGAATTNYGATSAFLTGYDYNECNSPKKRSVFWVDLPTNIGGADSMLVIWKSTSTPATNISDTIDIRWLTRDISANEYTMTWNTYDGSNAWTSAGGDYQSTILGTYAFDSADIVSGATCTLVVKGAVFDSIMFGSKANNGYIAISRSDANYACGTNSVVSQFSGRSKNYANPADFPKYVYMAVDTFIVDTINSTTYVHDAWMNPALFNEDNNYGDSSHARLAYNPAGTQYCTLVKTNNIADLIGASSTIKYCSLSVQIQAVSNAGGALGIFRVFKPWNEGALKGSNPADAATGAGVVTLNDWSNDGEEWNDAGCQNADDGGSDNSGDNAGADRAATAMGSNTINGAGRVIYPITTSVAQGWVDGTYNENGVLFMFTNSDGDAIMYMSEAAAGNRPYFIFKYIEGDAVVDNTPNKRVTVSKVGHRVYPGEMSKRVSP